MTTEAWIIGLHLWSSHFGACYPMPEGCRAYASATPGIYWRAPSGLTVGGYRNSFGGDSAYAGWTFETADRRFALTVAGASGYPRASVIPLVVPSVRVGLAEHLSLRLAGTPRVEKGGAAMAHLALEWQTALR